MTDHKIFKVLFLCTGNSSRSIIAEAAKAAGEVCPRWPGHPVTAHWSFEDPATFVGGEEARRQRFAKVCREIKNRLDILSMLPFETRSRVAIKEELNAMVQPDFRPVNKLR